MGLTQDRSGFQAQQSALMKPLSLGAGLKSEWAKGHLRGLPGVKPKPARLGRESPFPEAYFPKPVWDYRSPWGLEETLGGCRDQVTSQKGRPPPPSASGAQPAWQRSASVGRARGQLTLTVAPRLHSHSAEAGVLTALPWSRLHSKLTAWRLPDSRVKAAWCSDDVPGNAPSCRPRVGGRGEGGLAPHLTLPPMAWNVSHLSLLKVWATARV